MSEFSGRLMVGAGTAKIEFPQEMFPTDGFSGVHDDPHVRAVLLDGGEKIALISVELVVVAKPFIMGLKKIVNEITGLEDGRIWIHGTHAISTPHAPGPKFRGGGKPAEATPEEQAKRKLFTDALIDAARLAITQASASMEPVSVGFGKGVSTVKESCRVYDARKDQREVQEGCGLENNEYRILKMIRDDGSCKALMFCFGMPANVLDNAGMKEGVRQVSSDAPGRACTILEEKLSAPVIFFMSAGADQRPKEKALEEAKDEDGSRIQIDKGVETGLELVEKIGGTMADEIFAAQENIVCDREAEVRASSGKFTCLNIPGGRDPEPTVDLALLAATVGDVALVASNPELTCASEVSLYAKSPYEKTMLITMTDGPKNCMADFKSFEAGLPEAKRSFSAPGAAEGLVEAMVESLKNL